MALLGNSLFADIIDHARLSRVNTMTGVLVKEEREKQKSMRRHRNTQGRCPYKDEGRDLSYVTRSQGMPEATGNWERQRNLPP